MVITSPATPDLLFAAAEDSSFRKKLTSSRKKATASKPPLYGGPRKGDLPRMGVACSKSFLDREDMIAMQDEFVEEEFYGEDMNERGNVFGRGVVSIGSSVSDGQEDEVVGERSLLWEGCRKLFDSIADYAMPRTISKVLLF